jgi:tRNA dimethylallyltransferase
LARKYAGEVINTDSRQVYRHMDIGTAKPSTSERAQVPHHLLDILDPDQDFGLGCFLKLARDQVQECRSRGVRPLVAGGAGQYIWALVEGWNVPGVPPDPEFRSAKERIAEESGPEALYQELLRVDPERAAQLDYRNVRRVIRALEVVRAGQVPIQARSTSASGYPAALVFGLTMNRQELYRRIDHRVDRMMEAGFLDEVIRLAALGYAMRRGPLSSPGYRELRLHLAGEISLDEAVQRTKYQTHRLARRQYTWFKLNDPRIRWLDASSEDLEAKASAVIDASLTHSLLC